MKAIDNPMVAFTALIIFIALAVYSYKQAHRDFVSEQLSQYDSKKTKPWHPRMNVLVDSGLIYQADLGALYNTEPVVLIMGEKK